MAADLLQISELFFSIQGESTFAGYPCIFIRVSGCNLRCSYCDAAYTYEEPGKSVSIAEILDFVNKYPRAIVEITGGEPLLQNNSHLLIEELLNQKRTVLLETNGSLNLDTIPDEVIKIVDLKCPDSGMHEKMLLENFSKLTLNDEIKCVLSSREDYDWAVKTLRQHNLLDNRLTSSPANQTKILFSPVTEKLDPAHLAEWLLLDNLPIKLQLQMHKIIWPDLDRGV